MNKLAVGERENDSNPHAPAPTDTWPQCRSWMRIAMRECEQQQQQPVSCSLEPEERKEERNGNSHPVSQSVSE